jgi:uncharacterized membrane protein (GlpM family)
VLYTVVKVAITAVLVVVIAEVAKRSSFFGALIASLPIVSILAMVWLYADQRDVDKIASLSTGIFWLVLPSLVLFLVLPVLLKRQVGFALSMVLACAATIVSYAVMVIVLKRLGIKL